MTASSDTGVQRFTTRDFRLQGGGVMMTVTGDKPLSKVALWGVKTTLCPEPYIAIRLAPGEEMNWSWSYDFTKID